MHGSRRRFVCDEMLLNANVCCSLRASKRHIYISRNYTLCTTGLMKCNSSRRIFTWETFNSRIECVPPLLYLELWMLLHAWLIRCIARVHFLSVASIVQHFDPAVCTHRIATHKRADLHQGEAGGVQFALRFDPLLAISNTFDHIEGRTVAYWSRITNI